MAPVERRWPVMLSDPAEIAGRLAVLRPRDCVYFCYEVTDAVAAVAALSALPASQRLLAGVAAGPVLWSAVRAVWGDDAVAQALMDYLRGPFPPPRGVPVFPAEWWDPLRDIALGQPGDPVAHGVFPSTPTKLARLALARCGAYPAAAVLRAADRAYARDRRYHAHDAVACALVHPDLDPTGLVDNLSGRQERGWRSRRKTHRLLAWARRDCR
jgi:hypothetical protein